FVLTHSQVARIGTKRKKLQKPYRPYTKARKGSKALPSTHYLAVELQSLTDIYRDNAIEDIAQEAGAYYDQRPKYRQMAKSRNFERLVGGPANVARIEELRASIAASWASEDRNDSAERMMRKAWIEELAELDPTYPYRRRIAKNMAELRKALGWTEEDVESGGDEEIPFAEMNRIIREEPKSVAAMHAKAVFKAINDRERMIKKALGDKYLTPERLAQADGYVEWHYKRPNVVYMAKTISEFQIAALLENGAEQMGDVIQVPKEAIREALVMGGRRKMYLVPEWLAAQLDDLPVNHRAGLIVESFAKPIVQMMKRWYLRVMLGDSERTIAAGHEGAIPKIPEAIKLLVTKEGKLYRDMQRYGAVGSSLWHEMNDPTMLKQFAKFRDLGKQKNFKEAVEAVFKAPLHAEDILRAAVYLEVLEKIEKGQPIRHWAGNLAMVEEVAKYSPAMAAAQVSRETLIDYGDFTPWENDVLRNFWWPFYSFQKKNLTFWPRSFVNAAREGAGGTPLKAAGRVALLNVPRWLTRVLWLYGIGMLWNYRDDEAQEKEESMPFWLRGQPHVNIGDMTYWGDTALNDFGEWFGLEETAGVFWRYTAGFIDLKEAGIEVAKTIAQAPVNKVYQGLTPLIKAPQTAITGVETWPNVWKGRHVASPASRRSLERAIVDLMGADAAKFYQSGKGERAFEDTLYAYFAGWWGRPMDVDTFTKQIRQTREYVTLKGKSKTTGRGPGQAKKGREAEWQEMRIRRRALMKRKSGE
ncbi:MAG: hypothetical protein ACYTEQ_31205, partial [Planctomycetota bacterium]